jgi:hypothetical protein
MRCASGYYIGSIRWVVMNFESAFDIFLVRVHVLTKLHRAAFQLTSFLCALKGFVFFYFF